jgi:hypothetical protein
MEGAEVCFALIAFPEILAVCIEDIILFNHEKVTKGFIDSGNFAPFGNETDRNSGIKYLVKLIIGRR